jgi:hypothetical protein
MELVDRWRGLFLGGLYTEALHLMGRKTLLMPFERIFWDQWQYFAIDPCKDSIASRTGGRIELRGSMLGEPPPTSATGPSGEKVYSIHVAPGAPVGGELSPDEKMSAMAGSKVTSTFRPTKADPRSLRRSCTLIRRQKARFSEMLLVGM